MKLIDHIKQNHGTQAAFSEANGYKHNQVSVMVKNGNYYVINGVLMIAKKEVK